MLINSCKMLQLLKTKIIINNNEKLNESQFDCNFFYDKYNFLFTHYFSYYFLKLEIRKDHF